MVLLAGVPVFVGLVVRLVGPPVEPLRMADRVTDVLVLGAVLPLVALVLGTAALGAELEDGTAVFLLATPLARWRIVAGKLIVAAGLTGVLVATSALLAGLLVAGDRGGLPGAVGAALGAASGAVVYAAVFIALSILTGRALVIGLLYVLVWEGIVSGLFAGVRLLSIRQYAIGIADGLVPGAGSAVGTAGGPALSAPAAILASAIVVAAAVAVAVSRLSRYEVKGTD
jgi:ABC-2 type transport system permease protein